jgi:hypothetical protein
MNKNEILKHLFKIQLVSFSKRNPITIVQIKTFAMDTLLTAWEMNLESEQFSDISEGIATWPSEPYTIDWDSINWN